MNLSLWWVWRPQAYWEWTNNEWKNWMSYLWLNNEARRAEGARVGVLCLSLGGLRAAQPHGNKPKEKTSPPLSVINLSLLFFWLNGWVKEKEKSKWRDEIEEWMGIEFVFSSLSGSWWIYESMERRRKEQTNSPAPRSQKLRGKSTTNKAIPQFLAGAGEAKELLDLLFGGGGGCWVVCLFFVGGYGLRQQP